MCLMEALFAVSKRQKIKMSGPDIASTTAVPCSDEKWSTATKIAADNLLCERESILGKSSSLQRNL